MIKITLKTIEVNKEEFIEEIVKLAFDLQNYTPIKFIDRKVFNQHFKTKLSELEFSKLINDLNEDGLFCSNIHYSKDYKTEIITKEVCLYIYSILNSNLCHNK